MGSDVRLQTRILQEYLDAKSETEEDEELRITQNQDPSLNKIVREMGGDRASGGERRSKRRRATEATKHSVREMKQSAESDGESSMEQQSKGEERWNKRR
ncbi:hypothetical protein N665_0090s0006 [Sinapis alba]|nr:hypothetical protein N665_0090s0006 [Sinapis alba]